MSEIQKVALVGKGLLGTAILSQLIHENFTVTVLTRSVSSLTDLPTGVTAVEVDYTSVPSLTAALTGHDAVISALNAHAILTQKPLIEASILAGVKRFIPTDYGALSVDPKAHALPRNDQLREIQTLLAEKAAANELTYTIFAVGAFLEIVLGKPVIVDCANHRVVWYDKGEHPFSTSSVDTVGKAVARGLRNASATRNRVVRVHDTVLTQAKLFALAKKLAGPGVSWAEESVDAKPALEGALERLKRDGPSPATIVPVLQGAFLGGQFDTAYERVDNEMLCLGLLTEEQLEDRYAALQ